MTEDNRIRDEIAAFVDRVLMTEAWEESGGEVADRIMRMLTEHGWSPRGSEDNRTPEVRAVLELSATQLVADWDNYAELYKWADNERTRRIRAILDRPTPASRVFLPNDQVSVGTVLMAKDGSPFRVPDAHTSEGLARVGVPFVEVLVPSPEEWQAAVDRASEERAIPEPTEGQNP